MPPQRASADLAFGEFSTGKTGEAIERMERAYASLEADEPDEDLAYFLSQLARWLYFAGRFELCEERNERALEIAERLRLAEVLSHALNTKGLLETQPGPLGDVPRTHRHALEIALENDIPEAHDARIHESERHRDATREPRRDRGADHPVSRARSPGRRPRD